ncbi:MAG: pyruvate synthase [Candidatus Aquicultor primus]|uniref:Pyruvate synthase n=1 Tax=Candidatus Aquicultor primus TaxID=1797195 RepID=A0A1F2US10_9ACTN|nr:MAG: pyruvate synthase [Candidatus Aquicultor primus]HCG99846.1 pyruvate synthase [Actinomycetota bacterium]
MAEVKLTEIRWHARGGQGAVTAAKLLAETALSQGRYFQAFPEYGPERMGAPIQAFTRISSEPIHIRSSIANPEIVVVLDPTLLKAVDVTSGMHEDGVLIVNTDDEPKAIRKAMGLKGRTIFTVNATRIAQETIGRPIPNTPMMGALVKATDMMPIENLTDYVRKSFGKKFSEEIIEGNVRAVERAYAEVKAE